MFSSIVGCFKMEQGEMTSEIIIIIMGMVFEHKRECISFICNVFE